MPLWARMAIERLDACCDLRTRAMLDELLDGYARTYGVVVDEPTRAAARDLCRRRFVASYNDRA